MGNPSEVPAVVRGFTNANELDDFRRGQMLSVWPTLDANQPPELPQLHEFPVALVPLTPEGEIPQSLIDKVSARVEVVDPTWIRWEEMSPVQRLMRREFVKSVLTALLTSTD